MKDELSLVRTESTNPAPTTHPTLVHHNHHHHLLQQGLGEGQKSAGVGDEIRVEIQESPIHEEIVVSSSVSASTGGDTGPHTIHLQSPGGSSHFVEGFVIANDKLGASSSSNGLHHVAFPHGNTIIVDNDGVVLNDQSLSFTAHQDAEEVEEFEGIQMVSLENGETIFVAMPKGHGREGSSSVVILDTSESSGVDVGTGDHHHHHHQEQVIANASEDEARNNHNNTSTTAIAMTTTTDPSKIKQESGGVLVGQGILHHHQQSSPAVNSSMILSTVDGVRYTCPSTNYKPAAVPSASSTALFLVATPDTRDNQSVSLSFREDNARSSNCLVATHNSGPADSVKHTMPPRKGVQNKIPEAKKAKMVFSSDPSANHSSALPLVPLPPTSGTNSAFSPSPGSGPSSSLVVPTFMSSAEQSSSSIALTRPEQLLMNPRQDVFLNGVGVAMSKPGVAAGGGSGVVKKNNSPKRVKRGSDSNNTKPKKGGGKGKGVKKGDQLQTKSPGLDDGDQIADSSEDEETPTRRCLVCLRRRRFTEDVFDPSKKLYYHIDILIAHLNIEVKGTSANTGLCPECLNHLQRWHVFNCAIAKRHEEAKNSGVKVLEKPVDLKPYEIRVYKNYDKISKVKEVFDGGTHHYYARRHLTEKDWDFFCSHLFHANSVKSEKSKALERFLVSREKLSQLFCTFCQELIPNGKKGYEQHMRKDHQQSPVLFPCDICGIAFPEKDMTASTEDYYPHWISHFYFNKCDECGKRFPTRRALGQHRHAVHANRQVTCEKCGKVLASRISLDLHLLRHLPANEKKQYMIKCKICKKKIAQWNLKSHMSIHNEDRPWKCDHCDATFKMKGALVSHRDVVHFNLKNHTCSICGEAFKSATSLRGHVRRHEGRKDYRCEVCHKEYYTYSALKGHKVVHQTDRNFVCPTCGKAFKKKKALDEHATLHTGEKRHRCPICGREIRVKSNLYKHLKIHKKSQSAPNSAAQPRRRRKVPSSATSTQPLNPFPSVQQDGVTSVNNESIGLIGATNSSNTAAATAGWPPTPPGTMVVALDNGVGEMTPLVVRFVTSGRDEDHHHHHHHHTNDHTTTILQLNTEQHAQLLNVVASSSSSTPQHSSTGDSSISRAAIPTIITTSSPEKYLTQAYHHSTMGHISTTHAVTIPPPTSHPTTTTTTPIISSNNNNSHLYGSTSTTATTLTSPSSSLPP